MKPYYRCRGMLHGGRIRCWHRGVISSNGRHYCRMHAPKNTEVSPIDNVLRASITRLAEHIVHRSGNNKKKAATIVERASDFLFTEVRRIIGEQLEEEP